MLGYLTLTAWLIAGAAGLYMFRTWLSRGGLDDQRSRRDGLPPSVFFTHLSLGAVGFCAWVGYLVTGLDALAWAAVGMLMLGIGLGICTVTLWTPYPTLPPPRPEGDIGPGGAGPATGMLATPTEDALAGQFGNDALAKTLSSEVLTSKLINEALSSLQPHQRPRPERKARGHLAPLIPAGHGIFAMITFVLAVITAIGAR